MPDRSREQARLIRAAGPLDAPHVARIHVASWQVAYRGIMPDPVIAQMNVAVRTERWSGLIAQRDWPVFLLDEGGTVVGFCHISAPRDADVPRERAGEITALHVLPELRGGGRGGALFAHAMADLVRRGLAECVLWVLEGNTPARQFYEKLGMRLDGGTKHYPGTTVPEVRYRLALSSARAGSSSVRSS